MGNITERKYHIIQLVTAIEDEKALARIQEDLEEIQRRENLLAKITKPMKKTLDVEEMKREQNWKPVDMEELDKIIKEMDIQEPIELLLSQLTK
ncbi:MAG TPA: hypothetical protein PK228_04220 [Saprospiraceae bacterium]|nr:hypothetical protein [Saprospiraceae bacterium]